MPDQKVSLLRGLGPFAAVVVGALAVAGCEERRAPADGAAADGPTPVKQTPEVEGPAAPEPASPGVVEGKVVYRGPLPEKTTMYVIEAGKLEAHTIITDRESGGLKNAVVWLEAVPPDASAALAALADTEDSALLDQVEWTFVPHVLAVRTGQEVRFRNSDIANHNVHSHTPGNSFNLATSTETEFTRSFRHATDARAIQLGCDLHPWMRAWIYVFDHPCFAVSDPKGDFRIENVPPGRWRLRVHHADGELSGALEVSVEEAATTKVEIEAGVASSR